MWKEKKLIYKKNPERYFANENGGSVGLLQSVWLVKESCSALLQIQKGKKLIKIWKVHCKVKVEQVRIWLSKKAQTFGKSKKPWKPEGGCEGGSWMSLNENENSGWKIEKQGR